MVKFSVIIIARNINDYIMEAMPYFEKQTFRDFEIVLVIESDEKEKFFKIKKTMCHHTLKGVVCDGTCFLDDPRFKTLKSQPHSKECGFKSMDTRIINSGRASPARARNIGAKNAKGEILAFIDDDAYPEADWLEKAAEDFDDKNLAALGGPSMAPKNATFFQRVSNKVYELSSKKTGIRYGEHKKKQEIDDWPTCNFFARKKDFDKVRGFDEKYWGGEDTQICYSLLKTGKKMIYDPEVKIYHHPRKTLGKHLKQTFFWGMWRGFFMRIHKQSRQLAFFIPSIFVLWLVIGALNSLISPLIFKIYLFSLAAYGIYLLYAGIRSRSLKLFIPVMIVTFLTHLSYGLGFIRGISSKNEPIKKTLNPSESLKIKK